MVEQGGEKLAYAVRLNGELHVSSVGPHARSTMVNWLYMQGVPVTNDWPDEKIRAVFARGSAMAKQQHGISVELVTLVMEVVAVADPETVDLTADPNGVAPRAT